MYWYAPCCLAHLLFADYFCDMSTISLDLKPSRSPQVLQQNLDGQLVLVHTAQAKILVINPVGALVWAQLDGNTSLSEIAEKIATDFSQPLSEVQTQILTFISEINNYSLIKYPSTL